MIKEFNNLEEIEKYYDKNTNTYIFNENGEWIHLVKFNFDLNIEANIDAYNIDALDIKCWNIDSSSVYARDIIAHNIKCFKIDAADINANNINVHHINACVIKAYDICTVDIIAQIINAHDIDYYGVCFAHDSIKCNSIKGRTKNSKHFTLDGKLEVEEMTNKEEKVQFVPDKESKNTKEEIVDFVVAPYALADVLLALHNDGVKEIYVTKSDNDIIVRIPKERLEKSVYHIKENGINESCCNGIKKD